jgi:phospholipid/cholesterol/gamma-HCH transport system substrate-binding protein
VTTETKVGAFVLASLAILTVTLLFLINAGSQGGSVPYRTYLRYAGGLEAGAPVLFGGINAGRVKQVRPWTSDPTRIEILMEFKKGTPVNEKSVAKLGSVSLMSGPALLISTGSKDGHRLAPGESIPSQEAATMDEIVAKVSTVADNANILMTQVQGELDGISGDARTLLANLNSMTGRPNQERIQTTLEQTSRLVTDARPKIDHMIDQLSVLTQNANDVVAKVGPVVDHADGAIQNVNGTVSEIRDPVRKDLAELQTTLQEAKELLANMQVIVRANDSKIDETVENLRMTTENLNQLTNSVKQRPWSLIRIKQPKDRKVPE